MTDPSSRIINQLGLHGSSQGDAELVQQLQLYKTPAIIRDMKQVFFYVQISANTTIQSPLEIYTNKGKTYLSGGGAIEPFQVNPYYTPLGTRRKFRVWEQVNSLLDLRVPDDKYFMELKLDEAQIEADPAGWVGQRDLQPVLRPDGQYEIKRSYNVEYFTQDPPEIVNPTPPPANIPVAGGVADVESFYFKEAFKKTSPQPLFCRIPQLDNGEPYNWTVINNGQSNDDKSHGTVVIHNRSQFQEMDLEFGHLVFKGKDGEYTRFGDTQVKNDVDPVDAQRAIWNTTDSQVKNEINNYQDFEYLDYNWEWPNSDQVTGTPNDFKTNLNNRYVAPSARNGAILAKRSEFGATTLPDEDLRIQTPPLKYNQQASSILFRFSVKLIHLF